MRLMVNVPLEPPTSQNFLLTEKRSRLWKSFSPKKKDRPRPTVIHTFTLLLYSLSPGPGTARVRGKHRTTTMEGGGIWV